MNNYTLEKRKRGRCLLIVEGKHEKDELFWLIFKCFPELNIDEDDVWIYGTNIYKLYDDIVKEYGDDWMNEDIDLPFVLSKKDHLEELYYRNDFTDIFLVFDYERHDPQFSQEKIFKMQKYFESSTDMGKLYLNYPMIESYMHLKSLSDDAYINRITPVSLQPGEKYKRLVKSESCIIKQINFPHKIDDLLAEKKYQITDSERENCCEAILGISTCDMESQLEKILYVIGNDKKEKTLKYQLKDWISKIGYANENMTYWEYMRHVFQKIVYYNICKASHIQNKEIYNQELRTQYENINLLKILNVQNEVSQNLETGFIWILSTCVLLIPDYNYQLVYN